MFQRYLTLFAFALLLSGLVRWSDNRGDIKIERSPASESQALRQEVIEALDQIVAAEIQFKSSHGHFTKLLNHLPYSLPAPVLDSYWVNVQESSNDRLLVSAISEESGKTRDVITINQDFRINANFTLPPPRREYLRAQALQHLEMIKEAGTMLQPRKGVFDNFFDFEITKYKQGAVAMATGTRAPVVGMIVDAPMQAPADIQEAKRAGNLLSEVLNTFPKIGGYKTGESHFLKGRSPAQKDFEIERIE